MNVKVLKYDSLEYRKEKDLYILEEDLNVTLQDNKGNKFTVTIKEGAKCDGLSVPAAFTWFLPKWDKKNELYNIAGIVHDALYASELVHKDIADDIFRGILRDSGVSRLKASTAEWCVEKFAKKHYGSDEYGMKDFIEISF